MTSVNRPNVKITKGSESNNSNGRKIAFKIPRVSVAATQAEPAFTVNTLTILVATSTANVLISQLCKNDLSPGGICNMVVLEHAENNLERPASPGQQVACG